MESLTGLVIKSPHVDRIIAGHKTWEIRGSATKRRGAIALIKSKSGTVVGRCEVVDCLGPLTIEDLRTNQSKHRISPEDLDHLPYAKTYAWVLGHARPVEPPIPYRHPPGAVIWVKLNDQNVPLFSRL